MQYSAGVVLVKKKKALMQLRDNIPGIVMPGHWCIPGGHVKKGENIKKAAIREFKEEIGYDLKNPQLFETGIYWIGRKKIKRHVFWENYDGRQEIKCLEGQKMEFKSPKNFSQMKIYPDHSKLIKKALRLAKQNISND